MRHACGTFVTAIPRTAPTGIQVSLEISLAPLTFLELLRLVLGLEDPYGNVFMSSICVQLMKLNPIELVEEGHYV